MFIVIKICRVCQKNYTINDGFLDCPVKAVAEWLGCQLAPWGYLGTGWNGPPLNIRHYVYNVNDLLIAVSLGRQYFFLVFSATALKCASILGTPCIFVRLMSIYVSAENSQRAEACGFPGPTTWFGRKPGDIFLIWMSVPTSYLSMLIFDWLPTHLWNTFQVNARDQSPPPWHQIPIQHATGCKAPGVWEPVS